VNNCPHEVKDAVEIRIHHILPFGVTKLFERRDLLDIAGAVQDNIDATKHLGRGVNQLLNLS